MAVEIVLVAVMVVAVVDSAVVAKSSVHQNEEAVVGNPRDRLFLCSFRELHPDPSPYLLPAPVPVS